MDGIYLDYAATTPMDPLVVTTITEAMTKFYGNPSSLYQIGREAKHEIETVRQQIAKEINANPQDIIFTSGGTESNNSALVQTAKRLSSKGNHLITTEAEHSSVYNTMGHLESEGYSVTYLPFDEYGHITIDDLKKSITEDTIIISIMHGNNEVGSIQDIDEIGQIAQNNHIFFHTDTVQTFLKLPIDVEAMHIDALAMSAHKIYGPKGIGFMYYRNSNADFQPLIKGGNQENKHRAGTENVPLIIGMGKAITVMGEDIESYRGHWTAMRHYLLNQAEELDLNFHINGPIGDELGNILNIWWSGHASDQSLIKFDLQNVFMSAGSACTAGSLEPSRVLVNMYGEDSPRVSESLRLSIGQGTTRQAIDEVLQLFVKFSH